MYCEPSPRLPSSSVFGPETENVVPVPFVDTLFTYHFDTAPAFITTTIFFQALPVLKIGPSVKAYPPQATRNGSPLSPALCIMNEFAVHPPKKRKYSNYC